MTSKLSPLPDMLSQEFLKLADHNIFVAANESTLRSGAMSSRISQLNIIDILYTACANKNYDESIRRIQATYMKKG